MHLFFNALDVSDMSILRCMMRKLAKHKSQNEFSFSAIDSKRIPFSIILNEKNRTEIRQFIPQFISGFTLMEFWRVTAAWSAVWCRKNYERREWRELAWAPALAAAVCRRRRSRRKLWTCPYRPGGLRHRAALLRSSLPPPPAGSRYYCIQQHKSDRTNSGAGRQRRRAAGNLWSAR